MCVLLCVYLCVHKISLFDNAFCKYWHVILIPALNHHTCWCLLTSLFSSIGEIFLGKLIGYTWFSFLKYYICIIIVYLLVVWSGKKKKVKTRATLCFKICYISTNFFNRFFFISDKVYYSIVQSLKMIWQFVPSNVTILPQIIIRYLLGIRCYTRFF